MSQGDVRLTLAREISPCPPRDITNHITGGCTSWEIRGVILAPPPKILRTTSQGCVRSRDKESNIPFSPPGYYEPYHKGVYVSPARYYEPYHRKLYDPCEMGSNITLSPLEYYKPYHRGVCTPPNVESNVTLSHPRYYEPNHRGVYVPAIWKVIFSYT